MNGKHQASAAAATDGNIGNANWGGIWNGDHPYATMGWKTSINSGDPPLRLWQRQRLLISQVGFCSGDLQYILGHMS
jgi:hypothetical protein